KLAGRPPDPRPYTGAQGRPAARGRGRARRGRHDAPRRRWHAPPGVGARRSPATGPLPPRIAARARPRCPLPARHAPGPGARPRTVHFRPTRRRNAAIQLLAVERVHERVAPRDRPVRRGVATAGAQNLATAYERRAAVLDVGHVGAERGGDRRDEELRPDDACGVEKLLLVG